MCWVKPGKLTGEGIGLVGQNDSSEFGFSNPNQVILWTPCSAVDAAYDFEKDCSKDTHGSSDFGVNIGGGGIWDATGNWFTGAMDEVAICHSALSNADVNKIMKTGFKAMTTSVDPRNRLTSN